MKKPRTRSSAGKLMLAVSTALVSQGTAQLISEDFESTAEGQPAAVLLNGNAQITGLRPVVNDLDEMDGDGMIATQLVSGVANTAGTGNGLQLLDDNINETSGYEVDVIPGVGSNPVTSLHVSFDIAWTDISGSTFTPPINDGDAIKMGLGGYGGSDSLVVNSGARRYFTVEFENDGVIDGLTGNTQMTSGVPVAVDLFANDSDTETISYDVPGGGTAMLAPDEVALYLDGSLEGTTIMMDNTDTMAPVALTGEFNIGRFGFASSNGGYGLSYVVDNLVVDEIVESSVLFKEDFETQTLGDNPQAARSTPGNPEIPGEPVPGGMVGDEWDEERYALVIDDLGTVLVDGLPKVNLAGTGNGMEIFDLKVDSGTFGTGGNTAVEWQIVPSTADEVSTLECSFDFVWQNEFAANHIFFAIGLYEPRPGHTSHNFGSKNERDVEVRFSGDGGIRIGTASPLFQCVNDQKHTFTVFVNDNDTEQVIYDDPMGVVRLADTNTVYMYVDGNFIGSTPYLDVRDNPVGTVRAGDSNIGRIGFVTSTNEEGGILQVDNICAAEITPSSGTPILFKDDFESSTVGNAPSADGPEGFTVVTGAANVAGGGAGNGIRQYDDADSTTISPPSPLKSDYQVDVPTVGNLHIQFDVAWNDISDGLTDLGLAKVRIGQSGNGMTSGTRSYFDLGFSGLGEVRFDSSESMTPPAPQQLTDGVPAHVDMFVNDNDTESVGYPSPAGGVGTLPADSWAVYIDGVFMGVDSFDSNVVSDPPAAPGTGGENLGRFGIVSATDDLNIDYTWDNICITTIPSVSVELQQPETVVISVAPNVTQLTFDSIEGNTYEISQSDDIGTIPFAVIAFVVAGPTGETTYTRIGALEDKEFFRVENIGPGAPE